MSQPNLKEIEQIWGSHKPLLKAVMKVLQPLIAVECGCGEYSTPIIKQANHLLTIEHDHVWAKKCVEAYPSEQSASRSHKWIVQKFRAQNPMRIADLPDGEYDIIVDFYKETAMGMGFFDLLFVDTFACCRVPAVLALAPKAKWMIIHDLEPPGLEVYEWGRLDKFLRPWTKVILKPPGIVRHSPIPWTMLCVKGSIPVNELNEVILPEGRELWDVDCELEELV